MFAPIAKMDYIRLALAIVASQGWEVHQMDVKNSFLHEDLSEEIYMEQPHGFIQDSSLVCRMKKSLYDLKQVLRAWIHNSLLILVLYVDDLLITDNSASTIVAVKRTLHDKFLMTDMGPLHFFLGLEISRDATGIKLSQAKYARDLLERFHMTDYKPAPTPFLSGGTITFEIHYATATALNLLGFTNFDWVGNNIDHKSTFGYSLNLGSGPICWSSKKQATIAFSSTEADYRGVVNITIQALWLQHFLTELGVQFHQLIVICYDNQSTLKFCRDPVQRQQTKHIEIHMHYIRDLVHNWVIDLQFCPSAE
eukprot:PITA_12286